MSLNFKQFLEEQYKERYKHFVIYSLPMTGKSKLARKISKEYGGYYLDVLSQLKGNSTLSKEIDTFFPDDFFKWLSNYNKEKFIVVDNIDFLINTWGTGQEEVFLNLIEKEESNTIYCFIIQKRKILFKREITNLSGKSRIINLFEIN